MVVIFYHKRNHAIPHIGHCPHHTQRTTCMPREYFMEDEGALMLDAMRLVAVAVLCYVYVRSVYVEH